MLRTIGSSPPRGSFDPVASLSASNASSFTISASNVLNRQNGVFFYGFAQQIAPFQGGFKYMSSPSKRTPVQNSGGSALPAVDCSGIYSFAFNAWIQTGLDPALVVGQEVDGQFWSRDSASPRRRSRWMSGLFE